MRGPPLASVLLLLVVALAVAPVAALPLDLAAGGTGHAAPAAVGTGPSATSAPVRGTTPVLGPPAPALGPAARAGPAPTDRSRPLRRPVVTERNTTAYLALAGDIETSRIATVTLDAGAAVAADGGRTRGAYRTTRLRRAFTAVEGNRSAQRAVLRRTADRLDDRIAALERREAAALDRYNAGESSTRAYLRELVAIDAAAGSLRETTGLLSTYNNAVGNPVPPERIARFRARLLPLEGPVRDHARAAMTGEDPATRVYVGTSADGVVMATIDRGPFARRYVREATVPSARERTGPDQFVASGDRFGAARDRFVELYPWVAENQNGLNIGTYGGEPFLTGAGVYSVSVDHPHGTSRTGDLITFLDGRSREPFREIQYKDLSTIPSSVAGTNTSAGVRLQVNRTRGGGPMLVRTTNATTGEPLRTTIYVDGERAGTTGLDGSRWLIAPRSTARVRGVRGNTSVSTLVFTNQGPGA